MESPEPVLLDLHSAFAASIADDATLDRRELGTLVHDGAILACDPLGGDSVAFARRFPAGAHRVEALVCRRHGDERVALARVVFSQRVPATFELATRGAEDVRALAPGQRFGYGVDAGMGCFAADGVVAELDRDTMLADLEAHRRLTWSWAVAHGRDGGHALVAFSSGGGDGVYASYVGLDAAGHPTCLVTDFGCIDVIVPELADDPSFRRRHVEAMYERLKLHAEDLAGPGRGAAYGAASEISALPADAAHLARHLVAELQQTSDAMKHDLFVFVLARLLVEPAAQRLVAPVLADLPRRVRAKLVVTVDRVDDRWRAALRELWADGDVKLRRRILAAELRAAAFAHDPVATAHATEALASHDEALLDAALRVVRDLDLRTGVTPSEPALARIREIAARLGTGQVQQMALEILARCGDDLAGPLASAEPRTRLAAAAALNNDRGNKGRADPVLAELARDPSLELDVRLAAAGRIEEPVARVAAYFAVGLAGHASAPIQLRYVGGPDAIAALDRLSSEASDAGVRAQALKYLAVAREIEEQRRR